MGARALCPTPPDDSASQAFVKGARVESFHSFAGRDCHKVGYIRASGPPRPASCRPHHDPIGLPHPSRPLEPCLSTGVAHKRGRMQTPEAIPDAGRAKIL